jgi:hypothetical protein
MKYIFLFGHRQQHGKDTCCDMLKETLSQRGVTSKRSFFAKLLKKQVAERYNLDFDKMEDNAYKLSRPSHLKPKQVEENGLIIEIPRTVRDVLIEEGCKARSIWENTWANYAYRELFDSNAEIGYISDYRYPNEYNCFDFSFNSYVGSVREINKPKVVRVLVHRPDGIFKNDGADGELPDLNSDMWDYTILNDGPPNAWQQRLEAQLHDMLLKYGV